MNDEKFSLENKVGFVIFIIIVLMMTFGVMCGCEVIKGKKSVIHDSVYVQKKDSGALRISGDTSKTSTDWWREIVGFRKDTTINNFIQQPAYIIREGGTKTEEKHLFNYDSAFKSLRDSLNVKQSVTEKTKDTQVLSFWQIIAICAGVSLAVAILIKVLGMFTIVKK